MSAPGPVTVELSGITEPATFARLSDALPALWESMRALPLGALQEDWFGYYLTHPDAEQRVAESLERKGAVVLSFALPDGTHLMCVRPAMPPGAVQDTGRTPPSIRAAW